MKAAERSDGLAAWLASRANLWRAAALRCDRARAGTIDPQEVLQLSRDYRSVARDLAGARRHLPDRAATRALEGLYANLHALHVPATPNVRERLADFVLRAIPASFRKVAPILAWSVAWFAACAVAGGWLIHWQPELITLFLPESAIDAVESGHVWTEHLFSVTPPAVASMAILANNISVALMALVSGVLLGLGAIYLLGINGLMLGAALAFTGSHGLAYGLLRFMLAHGMVELSVICLSAAAGTYVGDALVRPGGRPRSAALAESVAQMAPLVAVCCVMLVGCGLIEGYVSPDAGISTPWRIAIGLAWWLVLAALLAGPQAIQTLRRARSKS